MPALGVEPDPRGELDMGEGRDERAAARARMCLARMPGARWCTRRAGHYDECATIAEARELPRNDFMPRGVKR